MMAKLSDLYVYIAFFTHPSVPFVLALQNCAIIYRPVELRRMARKRYSDDVLEVIHRLLMITGEPEFICSDNGGEFVAEHLQDWLKRVGVKPIQI